MTAFPPVSVPAACVIGWPVSHSLSPHLHGYWLKAYGIEGRYTAEAVAPGTLRDALRRLADAGYRGCNLTLPHKEDALELMDALAPSAQACGAVNTVVIEDGKMTGHASDGFGFVENLRMQHPGFRTDRVVMIGTGGAARCVIDALKGAAGAALPHFVLINRTVARAEKIAADMGIRADVLPWEDRHAALADASLLINGTSLGMASQPPLEIDLSALPPDAAVADLVYRPLETPLLAAARARGNPAVDGLGMLLHQGRPGFRAWFGRDPAVTPALYEHMKGLAA